MSSGKINFNYELETSSATQPFNDAAYKAQQRGIALIDKLPDDDESSDLRTKFGDCLQ
jgi:hypothetical protein